MPWKMPGRQVITLVLVKPDEPLLLVQLLLQQPLLLLVLLLTEHLPVEHC
jgi:hypothetical protein